jgi:hypothetical protein
MDHLIGMVNKPGFFEHLPVYIERNEVRDKQNKESGAIPYPDPFIDSELFYNSFHIIIKDDPGIDKNKSKR